MVGGDGMKRSNPNSGVKLTYDDLDVAVENFDLHLAGPREVRRRLANRGGGHAVLLVKRVHVVNAHPHQPPE
jgi:hypothetical protein